MRAATDKESGILPAANAPLLPYAAKSLKSQDLADPALVPANIVHLKTRAFNANRRAKASCNPARAAFYRRKADAINALLVAGFAFVDVVDSSRPDPLIGIEFAGGGKLHTKLSCLDSGALRRVLKQLMRYLELKGLNQSCNLTDALRVSAAPKSGDPRDSDAFTSGVLSF